MKTFPLAVALSLSAAAASTTSRSRAGAPLPELTLPSLGHGSPRSLSEFRGQKLVLHVWAWW